MREYFTHYNNGQLKEHFFQDENGNLQDEYKLYYDNGQIKIHCFFNENGYRQGEFKWWFDNGQLWCHYFFKNGKEITIKEWYDLQMKEKLDSILKWN